jgi:hypothetical protein
MRAVARAASLLRRAAARARTAWNAVPSGPSSLSR